MNWYLAKIVYRITCGDGDRSGQFDEQLRLIIAASKEEAFIKAQNIGQQEEEIFFNRKQQLVCWQFINVCGLYKISKLIDGAELYSRIEERDNADEYIHIVNKRAEHIQFDNTLEILDLV